MAERKNTGKTGRSGAQSRSKKAAELEAQRIREEAMRRSLQNRRIASVILFAVGILLTLLALIPGSMGWRVLYDVMHGLFGFIAWAVGPLTISAAFVISSQKTHSTITVTLLKRSLFMLMLCAAVEIFAVGKVNGENFFKVIENLYINGKALSGGGVFAIVLGVPLLFLGKLGACIVIVILAIVCVLLMIETPLSELFSGIGGSLKNAQANVSEKRVLRREQRSITDEQYRELERREQERKAQAREAKRLEREERRQRMASYYVSDDKKKKMKEMREIVNSVDDLDKAEETAEVIVPEMPKKFERSEVITDRDNELPEPLQPQSSKVKMPKVSDTTALIEEQNADVRDYRDALKKYMERKHPIMRDPEPADPNKFEDSDADIVPLIDALDKLNSEKGPARVSKIMDAPKSDVTTSDRSVDEERRAEARVIESVRSASEPDDITDIDEAELPFDLEDIIAANSPKAFEAGRSKLPDPPEPEKRDPAKDIAPINAQPLTRNEPEQQYKLSDVYTLPPMSLLDEVKKPVKPDDIEAEMKQNADKLVKTLESFGVQTTYLGASRGPSVTRYELQPAPGVKLSKIANLADDVALNLAVGGVRIAPVPDKPAVGIEIPNKVKDTVFFRELADTAEFKKTFDKKLVTVLGKDISGESVTCNITKMPHLLIAGTTGSGKSVCVNSIIMSILMKSTPDDVRLIMVDPKQVEFMMYNGIPHLLIPVVTEPKKAAGALAWAVTEMENRYTLFSENNVRNIDGYNEQVKNSGGELEHMPHIVIFIDELADLMMASPKDVEDSIVRLAQKARAAGMHLVIATQKPTVQVVTGLIKGNIPSRIALLVSSNSDSRVILDAVGAEKLLGNGDMLYQPVGIQKPVRLQGCYVSDSEIERVVEFIKQTFEAEYDESIIAEIERQTEMVSAGANGRDGSSDEYDDGEQDDKLEEAIEYVIEAGQASTSSLQRRLKLGYGRAARLIDTMEKMGVVGGYEGSKPRQVLMTRQEWYERKMRE